MKTIAKIITIAAASLCAATLFPPVAAFAQDGSADPDAEYAVSLIPAGEPAPPFTLSDLDGNPHSPVGEFPGKWVVLDFWASWCRDCRADMPRMKELQAAADPGKVVFVGVSFDTDSGAMAKYLADEKIPWLQVTGLVRMKDSPVADIYGIKWIPSIYLIDPEGNVALSTVVIEKLAQKLESL